MNKSNFSTSQLRNLGESMIKLGDESLGTALLELADYRSKERKIMARSSFDRVLMAQANPDAIETMVKKDISRMLADKLVEDRIAQFYQSFDHETNQIIFHGEVNVLKGE